MKRHPVALLPVILLCVGAASHKQMATSQKQGSTKQDAAHPNGAAPVVDTSAWKTYRNEKHNFEVRYPETWGVNSGSGMGVDIITIRGKPVRGEEPVASLTLAIQKDQNPKKLSIEEWFAEQLKLQHASPESSGHVTIGAQAAVFMENTNSFGKRRDTFTTILPIQIGNDKSAWLRSAPGLSGKIRLNLRRAAVDEKFDASDKTGVGRREKKRSRRDFFGFANAAHGNLRDELLFDFLGYVDEHPSIDGARAENVNANITVS